MQIKSLIQSYLKYLPPEFSHILSSFPIQARDKRLNNFNHRLTAGKKCGENSSSHVYTRSKRCCYDKDTGLGDPELILVMSLPYK